MAKRIQIRRDTAANWASVNPILAQGEMGYDLTSGVLKIGDGATAWNSLNALLDAEGLVSIIIADDDAMLSLYNALLPYILNP